MAETLSNIGMQPLAVLQDPRVVSTALGVWGANALRKYLYESNRATYGYALKKEDKVDYYKDPAGDTLLPSARTNRLVLHVGFVLAGTLLMTYGPERRDDVLSTPENAPDGDTAKIVKYAGLGLGASGFANLLMALLQVEQ